jgi:hypothetical protein
MKKIFYFCFIAISLVVTSSCHYDDTEVLDRISALEERVNAVEVLLKASADNLTIISVTETENGIVVTFSDNSTITINNSSNGNSPITDIQEDGDMVYITLDDGTVLVFRKYEFDENCKVYYTTTDDRMLFCDSGFGAILVSSIFENGQGTLIFDKPVTSSGGYSGMERLKSIVLPPTIETMGSFYECTGLKEIYCKATTPPAADAHFLSKYGIPQGYIPLGCIVYVPNESVELYKNAQYWSDYKNYIVGYDFNE